ncbi:hypothetical protein PI124_g1691 [Phytophthora idaei]|nr:hypothetical protein PI125_g6625 [Phytophthora idaei]KAG3157087.1 hypothetical protein PI126_g8470 [Phytophthora idaei]KAG3253718.1 hypothetical protein PI124_g1691 [Phytophthora idaei]
MIMAMVDGELHPSLNCCAPSAKCAWKDTSGDPVMSEQPVTVSEPKNAVEDARARSNEQTVAANGRGSTTTGCSGDEQCEEKTKDGKASGADAERAVLTSNSATRVTSEQNTRQTSECEEQFG